MKKALVVMLVAALSLPALILSGCGESADKAKAQDYMFAGDGYYDAFVEKWESLNEEQTAVVMKVMGGDTSAISGAAGEELEKKAEELMAAMEEDLDAADEQYEMIKGLSGVADYQEYAGLMQEAIALWREVLDSAKEFKSVLTQVIADFVAGKVTADVVQKQLMESETIKKITELVEEAEAKADEADELRVSKKLEE